jgi:hypothetical protein
MKTDLKLLILLVLTTCLAFFSCSENSQEPAPPETANDYFPNKNGSAYTFDFEITDSLNNKVIAERSTLYTGTKPIDNVTYQILVDEFKYVAYTITDSAYFRKLDKEVFYSSDNSQIMGFIPDSLRSQVVVDNEACLLNFPLTVGKNWQVYKLAINFGVFLFNVVNVTANVEKKENISLTVNSVPFTKEAVKLKFQMAVSFDISMPVQNFFAEAWMVDGVGLVKLEGDSEAINFMIGNNLFLPGGHIKQTLKQYSIP